MDLPWDDMKVAFSIEEPDATWGNSAFEKQLPPGWYLVGCDGSGARYVIVFRIKGRITIKDGHFVQRLIAAFERGYKP